VTARRPVALVILDGWGNNPRKDHNAVALARRPFFDSLAARWPSTELKTSGEDVGLPPRTMGNSEVGHMNIGAGRVVWQALARISKDVREGRFYENAVLRDAMKGRKTVHLMGLLSTGGVHGEIDHALALVALAKRSKVADVRVHLFMDGRDMPPTSGADLVRRFRNGLKSLKAGRIVTVTGRYWAMDRDKRWDRTEKAWRAIVLGEGETADDPVAALEAWYKKSAGTSQSGDEFFPPTVIEPAPIADGDSVVHWNFRPDRARQLTRAIAFPDFPEQDGFARPRAPNVRYACMCEVDSSFGLPVAYPREDLRNVLAEVVARAGRTQFHTAETEKYAHVTYFLNGGREAPFPGETWRLVPSPKVATYDLQPEMSAAGVTDAALEGWRDADLLVVNYANGDMVGHTGSLPAAIRAVEAVDACLARLVPAVLARGGAAIVTADHGNCEQMIHYETGEPHTQHTLFPVPCIVCGAGAGPLRAGGRLADLAPTVLDLMGLPKPGAMTGAGLRAPPTP
jgi:2,3-bisphosphoglycerate-independent phosphoglycerate mutase